MTNQDENAWVREFERIEKRQLIGEERYKQLDKQIEDAMRSEYAAMNQMAKSSPEARQDLIYEQNKAYLEQQLEYSRTKQAAIYNRIRIAATTFAVILIIYTLFHMA